MSDRLEWIVQPGRIEDPESFELFKRQVLGLPVRGTDRVSGRNGHGKVIDVRQDDDGVIAVIEVEEWLD